MSRKPGDWWEFDAFVDPDDWQEPQQFVTLRMGDSGPPHTMAVTVRVKKRAYRGSIDGAGRLLDGRTWEQRP